MGPYDGLNAVFYVNFNEYTTTMRGSLDPLAFPQNTHTHTIHADRRTHSLTHTYTHIHTHSHTHTHTHTHKRTHTHTNTHTLYHVFDLCKG